MTDPRAEVLRDLLTNYERIAIIGGPRTGKTTLMGLVDDRPTVSTDGLRHLPWEDVPTVLVDRCVALGRFVVEGVQVPRALRKGLVVDAVLYLDLPKAEQNKGQVSMTKAVATVFREWRDANPTVHVVSPDLS